MVEHSFFATAPKHLESLLADELRQLGIARARETRGGVQFTGSLMDAYRVCLWSRVAHGVLLELARFPAPTPDALYAGCREIAWQDHFDVEQTFAVDCNSVQSAITHSQFAALKIKDAVVDQFREQSGQRPTVQVQRPDVRINLYLHRDQATVSLDLSGESLHRRGYRTERGAAPLRETLAAAVLLRANWPAIAGEGGCFVDPMCGSGTLPIEAALIAADIAPGLLREHWGFLAWKQHHAEDWSTLLADATHRRHLGLAHLPAIRGFDADAKVVRIAWANIERAGLHGHVHVERRGLEGCRPVTSDKPGLLATNPPYGERLGQSAQLSELYAQLGATLGNHFQGWHAAILVGNSELGAQLGLRIQRKHTLYNGPIECKLLHFELTAESLAGPRRGPRPLAAEKRSDGAKMLANRLRKNAKNLARWRQQQDIHCFRLYDADLPEYALAIDIYEGAQRWVHVQEYEAPSSIDADKAKLRLREALGVILEFAEIPESQLFFKIRRRQKGTAQYERLGSTDNFAEVTENDCRFLVNFADYLDTGLFLDHRQTRQRIAELAANEDFLNLFAYTGTASVYAAKGGASSTTTVDMSKTYLDWARRNMALNGYTGSQHEFVQADCLRWLEQQRTARRFGLIFLDPPSFSTSKRMSATFDVQRDHVDLIANTCRLLQPKGTLIFSNNLRRFRLDLEALSDFEVEDITRATIPRDFSRSPHIHRCWQIRSRER